jgi:hypothetical protein
MARMALAGALVCLLGACGDGGSGTAGEGSLTLRIITTGIDFDPDGYSLSLDAGTPQPVAVNDTLELQDLAAGEHTVQLDGITGNCLAVSPNPSAVSVEAGVSTDAAMAIECFERAGVIQIRTFTYGEGGDPDGFVVRVDTLIRSIPLTGAVAVAVRPGTYEVLLDRLTDQCGVDGPNPEVVSVAPETVARVTFVVRCAPG